VISSARLKRKRRLSSVVVANTAASKAPSTIASRASMARSSWCQMPATMPSLNAA